MRLLVVSRSPMMAMTLRAEGFDVSDLRPPRFTEWLQSDSDEVDALVLDLADPRVALQAVIELRARARMAPALLVSGEDDGWDELAVRELPAAQVLPLPVTRPALLSALSELLNGQDPEASDTEVSADQTAGTAAESDLAESEAARENNGAPPAVASDKNLPQAPGFNTAPAFPADASAASAVAIDLTPIPEFGARATFPEPLPPAPPAPEGEPRDATIPTSLDAAEPQIEPINTEPTSNQPEAQATLRVDAQAHPPAPATFAAVPPAPHRHAAGDLDAPYLVRMLRERVSDLASVAEVAEVVIADAVDRVRAQAGALLVPDGTRWRVSGSVGLRTLERRLELDESSWLVTEVAHGGKGLIVEDSDIARNSLKGAPLASWRQLLVAPIALVEAILVLARGDNPFEEADLADLVTLNREAGPLLQVAMETRALARSLGDFADLET